MSPCQREINITIPRNLSEEVNSQNISPTNEGRADLLNRVGIITGMKSITALHDMRKFVTILVFLLVFFIALSPPQDADMWWHLSAGKAMVEQGKIITTDIFSYTKSGAPWTNAFWLPDILLYLAFKSGGYLGITILSAGIAVLLMLIVHAQSADAPFPVPHAILLLAAIAIAPVWTPRPQIFSFLLLALLDLGLNRQNGFILQRPWALVPLFALWSNVHGGYIWGFLLLAAVLAGNRLDSVMKRENTHLEKAPVKLTLWTLASALAIGLNPNGLSLWKLPFYTVGVSIQSITEWGSPDFHQISLHPLLWMMFLLIAALANSRRFLGWGDTLKIIGFAYMAFVSQRSIGPFVVIAAPVLASTLAPLWEDGKTAILALSGRIFKSRTSKPIPPMLAFALNLLVLTLFSAVTLLRAVSVSQSVEVHTGLPRDAVTWMRQNQPAGKIFNAYNWGGYLQWELPEYPVFIDGRADLYGDEIITEWWHVVEAREDAFAILNKWEIDLIFLEPGWRILEKLTDNGWEVLYQDGVAVILGRP